VVGDNQQMEGEEDGAELEKGDLGIDLVSVSRICNGT
jgi:hypothetical protein